jgi:NAD(P)H-nitrite reductase large subunit
VKETAYDYLLLGGGAASVAAARALRRENYTASIAILCGESMLPYKRPPLTKGFLTGDIDALQLALHPVEFYHEQRIEVVIGASAAQVDRARRSVTTSDGRVFGYGKLLVATGASPQRLHVPGSNLPGVQVIHDIGDAAALRRIA